jgi:hypothetical protein
MHIGFLSIEVLESKQSNDILFWLPTGKNLPQNKTRSCITGSRDNSRSNPNYHLNNKQKKKLCMLDVNNL